MQYICHRVNTLEELRRVDSRYGAEIDLRDNLQGRIYLCRDPFSEGEDFEEYLKVYKPHGTLILNIKSERVELKALDLLEKYQVKDYFFLDSSFPMIYLLSEKGEHNIAQRFSELEPAEGIRRLVGRVGWVWVDCFSYMPLTPELCEEFKALGYKLCLVSPELQGQPEKLVEYAGYLRENHMELDAICAKCYMVEKWVELLGE